MSHPWIAADTDGYDLEDLEAPRRISDTCPACARQVTLVERERLRNLHVLGVALVATARGGTVFQCERCGTCFEPPPAPSPATTTAQAAPPLDGHDDAALAVLERKLRDADDETALWRMRMDLATRRREPELAREARTLIDRYAAVSETLRGEIAALRSARTNAPATAVATAPVEDELEALRRRMAERAAAKPAPAATPTTTPESLPGPPATPAAAPAAPAVAAADDELAALKRRLLGDRPAPTTPATPATPAAPPGAEPTAAPSPPEEDEMAALKRKLRGK